MSLFTKVVVKVPKRNAFDLSHENHCTAEMGTLYPILIQECLPGDKFKISTEAIIKLAPMLAPVFSRIDVYFHFFQVPNRLVYSEWEKFITGGENGLFGLDANGDNDPLVSPYFKLAEAAARSLLPTGSLADFMGIPTLPAQVATDLNTRFDTPISALPFLCYHKIFSDWFRDEQLQPGEFTPANSGAITGSSLDSLLAFHKRAWHKDYFTSARPDTQLGAPVVVPTSGVLKADGNLILGVNTSASSASGRVFGYAGSSTLNENSDGTFTSGTIRAKNAANATDGFNARYVEGISLEGTGISINDFRRSLRLQEWAEKSMRGGNRYIESIFQHFGVKSSDARLQRSRYIGGKKVPVMVGEVLQSTDTNANTDFSTSAEPLGRRAGVASSVGKTGSIKCYCEEHGFIIGIMSIMPKTSYYQGVPRYLAQRYDKFDYAWPEFGNLGEQEVYNYELFLDVTSGAKNFDAFGYQSRFADYKFTPSRVHGDFKSSLAYWHNARKFNSAPALNSSFIQLDNFDQNRIFAVTQTTTDHFYCHLFNDVKVLRMLPKYGIPSI